MAEDQFTRIYEIVWSLIAISIGGFGAFYTDKFVSKNVRAFEKMYAKTGFFLFKKQAEGMGAPYMWWMAKLLGSFFLVIGILVLFGFIAIGK